MTLKIAIIKALLIIGFTMVLLPLASTLNTLQSLLIGLVISFLLYAGDLIIFPRINVPAATTVDIAIILIALWMGVRLLGGLGLTVPVSFLYAFVIGIGEWFFHRYVRANVVSR